MATDILDNVDISVLKRAIFGPSESQHQQPISRHDLNLDDHIAPVIDLRSAPRSAAPESVPELPSTVSDSQFFPNVESQIEFLPPPLASDKATATGQKMTSQGSDAATQELSPSHYEEILSKNRSARQLQAQEQERGSDEYSDREDETGVTLHKGDKGYTDLLSSFDSQKEASNHGGQEHSEPIGVDFSPTQSQSALSQFPESQRFKTPATAGKKRRYNGDVADSPELPRNPFPRGGESHEHVMGLSQAFAATQANTSPFIGNVNGDLYSDRPSPNIDMQPRPMTATTSSPMRPISTFKRASTEPASHYITSKQSQARREAARRKQSEIVEYEGSDEDDLEIQQESWDYRDRKQRERYEKIQARLSSPSERVTRGASLSKSSPIRGPERTSPRSTRPVKRPRLEPYSSPIKHNQEIPGNESEEETEQEDNSDVAVTRSSQLMMPVDEGDKENFSDRASQVPETTVRFHRVLNDPPTQVQDSPLLRHGRRFNDQTHSTTLNSSQPFAVADSQPERLLKQPQTITQVPGSSAAEEVLDYVPQSPEASPRSTAPVHRENQSGTPNASNRVETVEEHVSTVQEPAGSEKQPVVSASNSRTRQLPGSTIPEPSSNEPQIQSGRDSDGKPQNCGPDSRDDFETARSHVEPSTTSVEQPTADTSSPQIATTPPGKKRMKRMVEIAAESSPPPLKSQVSFNASEALRLDANFQGPVRGIITPKRMTAEAATETEPPAVSSEDTQEEAHAPVPVQEEVYDPQHNLNGPEDQPLKPMGKGSEQPMKLATPLSIYPRRDRRPTAKVLSARNARAETTFHPARASQWDLPNSSPQKVVLVSKPSAGLKRKARDTNDLPAETSGNASKRIKTAKSIAAPNSPLRNNVEKQQDSPNTIALNGLADLHYAAEPGLHNDVPETAGEEIVAANMVFACFNGKSRTYHPAICRGRPNADSNRFIIQWEGYDPDEVDEYGVRSLDLQIGDQVKLDMEGFPKVLHVIRGFKDKITEADAGTDQTVTDIRGYRTLLVAPKQRKSLLANVSTDTVKKVPVAAIYLDSIMWGQMKDRPYEYKPTSHANVSVLSSISTPMERASTPSTPSSRNRRGVAATKPPSSSAIDWSEGLFSSMAFAISYEDSSRKRKLLDLIQQHGGVVLRESFLDLFEPDSVELRPQFTNFTFTALLTDRHSRKEKYLQALALGLPCLSGKWIEACAVVDKLVDWATYLLPAGESTELDGATKSRILTLRADIDSMKLEDMIASRPSIFAASRVIVVMGKGKAETKRKPYLTLIRALGPSQMDLEPDLHSARVSLESAMDGGERVDYVFVDDRDVEAAKDVFSCTTGQTEAQPERGRKRGRTKQPTSDQSETKKAAMINAKASVKVMCNEDIVQSLILGRLWIGPS